MANLRTEIARAIVRVESLVGESMPVDLQHVARQVGISRIDRVDFGGQPIDALLLPNGNGALEVLLNRLHGEARNRFSLGHEIGHVLLADAKSGVRFRKAACGGSAADPVERACNQIATNLLMPEIPFSNALRQYGSSLQMLPTVATLFGTSLEATVRRMVELNEEPVAYIKWREHPETGMPRPIYSPVRSKCAPRIAGFDRRFSAVSQPGLSMALENPGTFHGEVYLEALAPGRNGTTPISAWAESRGFGIDSNRTIYSVCYLDVR